MNPLISTPWAALLGRRLVQVLAVSLLIGTLCFLMVRALPGDLAMRVAAGRYGYDLVSNAAADAVRAELGLDRPGWLALLHWWRDMATFNLGQSLVSQRPVWHEVAHHLGATLRLSAAALADHIPGLRPDWSEAAFEPSCRDIDVGGLHAAYLRAAKRAGALLSVRTPLLSARHATGGWTVIWTTSR